MVWTYAYPTWLFVGINQTVLVFVRVCYITPLGFFVVVSHHIIQCWFNLSHLVVFITGGDWLPLVNLFSFLHHTFLACTWSSLLLVDILFNGRSQWLHEPLGYVPFFYRVCLSPSTSYFLPRNCMAWSRCLHNLAWSVPAISQCLSSHHHNDVIGWKYW